MTESNIPAKFFGLAASLPDSTAYSAPELGSDQVLHWKEHSYATCREQVIKVANYLLRLGVKKNHKIAILSNTRPQWCIADLASLACGGVTVSIYQSLPSADVGYILYDSHSDVIFAENQEQVNKLIELSARPIMIAGTEERSEREVQLLFRKIICFEQCISHPAVVQWDSIINDPNLSKSGDIEQILKQIEPDDLASLVYTSGTTGPPKGVMQSHSNHLANVRQASQSGIFSSQGSIFLFLPLAHSFARLIGYLGFLTEVQLKFGRVHNQINSKQDPQVLAEDMQSSAAELIPTVPRMLEKIQDSLLALSKKPGLSGMVLRLTINSALEVNRAASQNSCASYWSQMIYFGTTSVRTKIRNKIFGPNFTHCVSGGARLPKEVCEFFDALGMPVYEGYGLTETCVATNVNRFDQKRVGSVGPRLADDIEIKITDDNEICFRGPNVTRGYINRPIATNAAWDEQGWFHSGDLGHIDQDGYLFITGRKKELIVTAGGKKIPSQKLEEHLKKSPFISQAVPFGEGKPYCVALVALCIEAVTSWAQRQAIDLKEPLNSDPSVIQLISSEIEGLNKDLASFETIKHFRILTEECSVENGLLTPTFKVKQNKVIEQNINLIEQMYSVSE